LRVLVTGSSGFIGQHLTTAIQNRGYEVIPFDRKHGFDIINQWQINGQVEQCDAVIHTAGVLGTCETLDDIYGTLETNIWGSVNVLEAARKYDKSVVLLCTPRVDWYNPYLISKRCVAELGLMYHGCFSTKVGIVRAFNVYGPGQHWGKVHKMIPTFIVNALRNEPLIIYGDGQQTVDLIHTRDLCEILLRTLEYNCYGTELQAGTGIETSVLDAAKMAIRLTDSQSQLIFKPMRSGEPRNSRLAADPMIVDYYLNYRDFKDLEDGLPETINWYKEHLQEVCDSEDPVYR
jgi:nucleoside-diphosphate-sugar epimerase